MQTVAIFGVGLIGGSFALALRKAGYTGRIAGVSSKATTERAIARGAIDEALPASAAAASADLIFLAQPIGVILETISAIAPYVQKHALVTDAGSTKSAIMAASRQISESLFVGGHPMAGREARGVDAASAELFQHRLWALTPARPDDMDRTQCREFIYWIERIGAIPLILDAAEHDRTVAFTSHLPQLLSSALAASLAERSPEGHEVHGPGLEDMTRLALSSFDIWADILTTNRENVAAALAAYVTALQTIHSNVVNSCYSDIRQLFEQGNSFAQAIRQSSNREPA